jgi:hypothetical protein
LFPGFAGGSDGHEAINFLRWRAGCSGVRAWKEFAAVFHVREFSFRACAGGHIEFCVLDQEMAEPQLIAAARKCERLAIMHPANVLP